MDPAAEASRGPQRAKCAFAGSTNRSDDAGNGENWRRPREGLEVVLYRSLTVYGVWCGADAYVDGVSVSAAGVDRAAAGGCAGPMCSWASPAPTRAVSVRSAAPA